MERLLLPDGGIIASGVQGEPAILSVRWKQSRNDGSQITLGSVCCASLEMELFSRNRPDIPPETRLIYQEDGITRGIFYCQELTRKSQNRWRLTALDGMHRFYREINGFWENRADDTVFTLLLGLCGYCGVATRLTQLPGGDTPVPKLAGYSAKQILKFLGQAAGRYFYMDGEENLCAGWFNEIQTVENYHQLTVAEFTTLPVERVWIRQTKDDVGFAFPGGEEEANTLIIQGNPIFSGDCTDAAERLFRQISTFSHTPFTCRLLPGQEVPPGTLVEFTDPDGISRIGAVMQWEKENGVLTLRGTGSHSLQSVQAFSELTLEELEGQVLSISRTAQGLAVSHKDLLGNVGALQLSMAGLETQVTQGLTEQNSALRQTAQGLELKVSRLEASLGDKTDREEFSRVTERFSFDGDGLTIQNSATGMGIRVSQEQVAFLGDGDPTTAIYPDAMESTKLSVEKRLDIGAFSLLPRTNGNLSFRFTGQG